MSIAVEPKLGAAPARCSSRYPQGSPLAAGKRVALTSVLGALQKWKRPFGVTQPPAFPRAGQDISRLCRARTFHTLSGPCTGEARRATSTDSEGGYAHR